MILFHLRIQWNVSVQSTRSLDPQRFAQWFEEDFEFFDDFLDENAQIIRLAIRRASGL
jgi:hypothetical protein